jgi:peptide/nickel transport system substrate-binding protein
VFNFNTHAVRRDDPEADPAKALAVRQAAADLVDRGDREGRLQGHLQPAVLVRPGRLAGATDAAEVDLRRRQRRTLADKAKKVLATPVSPPRSR